MHRGDCADGVLATRKSVARKCSEGAARVR